MASAVKKAPYLSELPEPVSLKSAAGRPTMSTPKTTGLANGSKSERVRPNCDSTLSVLERTTVEVSGVAGGTNALPEKLDVVTPKEPAIMLVSCVTPTEMLPPPTLGMTANNDWPAGKL